MALRYVILQRMPFPGTWAPMPTWQLQKAEQALGLNHMHYSRQVARLGTLLAYRYDHAVIIRNYWQVKHLFAEYMLIGHFIRGTSHE